MSPYHHSLSRLLQLSNFPRHSIVFQVSKASDNPFQDSEWMFWFFIEMDANVKAKSYHAPLYVSVTAESTAIMGK